MSTAVEYTANHELPFVSSGLLKRLSVLTYGMVAYVTGCVGLFWLILGFGGLVPVGVSGVKVESTTSAVLVNIALIVLFAVQHTVMARSGFKQWLSRYLPVAAERATFMLFSGVMSILAVYFWQSLPGTVWAVENTTLQIVLQAGYALAWAYMLLATFVTNHFELMGLRQVYLYFRNQPYQPLPFTNRLMYRYSRHPMMLGFLVGMWSVPVMSAGHLVMAMLFTLYIFFGITFEERDLTRKFGETYRKYKKEIAAFIPGIY
ncbi:MAG: NnrU family protein [Gammaproteobacteria bacterium]|nr:NnrU family protein [Gammaproteobacteria bacterium]MDH5650546.1 NnrU family protein [Gammaproteobacteria bacterium]